MIYIVILFILLFIIIIFYYINKNIIIEKYFEELELELELEQEEEQEPIIYSNNVCGRVGKECVVINNKTNSCCDGLYCVRKKGNFHNRICSKTPDNARDKSFKDGMYKIGDYIKRLKNKVFIEDCPLDEEGNEINDNYKLRNMCANGFYRIPIPCKSKKKSNNNDSFKFPETTLFSSVGDRNCIK
jgi:hypothetical protein